MNAKLLRLALGLAVLTAIAGAAPQPPKKNDGAPAKQAGNPLLERRAKELSQQYEQRKKQFFAAREKANEALGDRFDAVLKQIKGNRRLPAEVRQAKLSTVTNEKSAFRTNGAFPQSDEMLPSLLDHQKAIYQAYRPAAQTYEQLSTLYSLSLKDDGRAQKLTADKEAFDQKARGNTEFQPCRWQGNQLGKNNIQFILHVGKVEGNSFKGGIVQDRPPVETVFKVEGLLRGNSIELHSTQVVQGRARELYFTGYVMENRIVGQVKSRANGKMSLPSLVLMYKR